jgi:hypothetical protein
MTLLDVIIDVLKINCSVVQCTGYASEIEALFYLFFFPTVFIILFIWVITGVITQQIGGKTGGLRILISVALYAFIVFQEYYTLFVSLSQLWWLLLATIVGLYIFIRKIIHGNGGGGGAGGRGMSAIRRKGVFSEFLKAADLDRNLNLIQQAADIRTVNEQIEALEKEIEVQEDLRKRRGTGAREKTEFARKISELEHLKKVAKIKLEDLKRLKKVED